MGTVEVARPPRAVPRLPEGELAVEPPPEPERVVPAGVLARLLPLAMVLASVGIIVVLPRNATSWLFGGMFLVSTLAMVASGAGRGGGGRSATVDEDRRDYLRYLAQLRRRVRGVAADQRAVLEQAHPPAAAWPAVLAAGRLWERRPTDADFGRLRIGHGPQRLATRLVAPRTGPVEGLEPLAALALRRFLAAHAVVPGLPVALSLRDSSTVWLEPAAGSADLRPARALARALVAQYALLHGPGDALLAVVAPPGRAGEWDWAKWLPHAAHPRRRDAVGAVRMLTGDVDAVRRWWAAELAGRRTGPGPGEPHLLLVVDEIADGPGPWAGVAGLTVLRVGPPPGRRAAPSVVRLLVGPDRVDRGGADHGGADQGSEDAPRAPVGVPDALGVAEALALARRLARYRPAGGTGPAGSGGARPATGLPALLGLAPGPAGVRAQWERRADADRLRVPIGRDEHGAPVLLDLKEAAQGGSGPHGLCIGATGSGKSELLRTLVLGLAATHSSEDLNLVLVDFKGGATFLGMASLPHVSAVITNLADELSLVDRMADALAGEITRRQELLRAAGNLTGVVEHAAARRAGADLPPLPALLVVVDEFSELLAQRPELLELLVTVGRLGRSLGLHLLLASQRLEEGRLRGLESHLSYRIALRTFSAAESRAVLGVPDAHQLPATPGAAYLATGTDELVRFRAAYVSAPDAPADRPARAAAPRRAHLFAAGPVRDAPGAARVPEPAGDGAGDGRTVLDAVVAAVAGLGPPAHRVWLPPLDDPPPLDELVGALRPVPGRGLVASGGRGGRLRVPVALVDRPYQQRRDPLLLDLSGADGHLVVVGGPRAGKSTALTTAVLALALSHTPAELGVHVLDLGGGALLALRGLPHVGTVADRLEPELVRRTVAEVTGLLATRERLFRDHGVTSVEEFRARRRAGEFADEPATDVLLVVDGHATLRDGFEDVEQRLLQVAAQGLALGVHLAVATGRWSDLRPALRDLCGSRLELRLGEPADSEVDRRRAAAVPARPGHGLAPDGAPMVLAAPRSTGRDTAELVAAVAAARPGPVFAPVRRLPERLDHDRLPPPDPGSAGLPVGVDEERLALVQLDPAAEPHLLCFADAESGKTALLRLLAHGIVERYRPDEARIVVVDPRRSLLGTVPDSHLIGYASTAATAASAAGEVAGSLRRRLPGPDVGPRALRERSWWTGPDVFVLVDDYDLLAPAGASGTPHPLLTLLEFLPQAKDVGLHLVVARRCGGAGRALFDPVLGRLRELAAPTLVMNGSPDEGVLAGSVRPGPQPPGRGVLVDRRRGARRVQVAWLPPEPDPGP